MRALADKYNFTLCPPKLGWLQLLVEIPLTTLLNANDTALLEEEAESHYMLRRNTPLRVFLILRQRHAGMYVKQNED